MCKWYCMSEGPNCNLECLHCRARYCGACLHGEYGKMESIIKCSRCGKKPRTKPNHERKKWAGESTTKIQETSRKGYFYGANEFGGSKKSLNDKKVEMEQQKYMNSLREEFYNSKAYEPNRPNSAYGYRIGQDANRPRTSSYDHRRRSSREGSIFDRLTDSSQYTGTHIHRFDATGRGRGLAGRDRVTKGRGMSEGTNALAVYHRAGATGAMRR